MGVVPFGGRTLVGLLVHLVFGPKPKRTLISIRFLFRSNPNSLHGDFDAPLVLTHVGRWRRDDFGRLRWRGGDRDGVLVSPCGCSSDLGSIDASLFGSFRPSQRRFFVGSLDGAHRCTDGQPDGWLPNGRRLSDGAAQWRTRLVA